jgi:hypothetical protein
VYIINWTNLFLKILHLRKINPNPKQCVYTMCLLIYILVLLRDRQKDQYSWASYIKFLSQLPRGNANRIK